MRCFQNSLEGFKAENAEDFFLNRIISLLCDIMNV